MATVTAKLNYLHIAPRKVRLLATPLRGLSVNEAQAQLWFRPQRSSKPLLQLIRSAMANAQQNYKMNPDALVIKDIRVDQGPMLKRFLPRAMGRATPIHKKMSHVTIVLEELAVTGSRFNVTPTKKTEKSKQSKAGKQKKEVLQREEYKLQETQEKVGFFKRFFRRKSV